MIYLYIFFLIVITIIIFEIVWITYHGLISKKKAKETKIFSRDIPHAMSKILIVGDSVILGVGATHLDESLAGKIATVYPESSITTVGINGSKTKDLLSLIDKPSDVAKWNTIIIFSGGMDIIHFVRSVTYANNLSNAFIYAKEIAHTVIYISPPNIGLAPIFPFPISHLYSLYSRKLRTVAKRITEKYHVTHVDLFREQENDHFKARPDLYSSDLSHPNSAGYEVWFKHFKEVIEEKKIHYT